MDARTSPGPVAEPFRSRWTRRAKTVPIMVGATGAGLVLAPVAVPALVAADLARGRWRLPSPRVYLFLLQYAVNDSIEILAAPALWVVARFGTRLRSEASVRRHERLQRWSLEVLARRAERLLGVRLELEPGSEASLGPGPVLVLSRHVNLLDASLPALLYQRLGYRVRSVIMAELLADPGFDLLYGRLDNAFIARDDDPGARRAVGRLAVDLSADTAVVVFPEGRLFRPEVLERSLARLAATNPARARRLAGLRRVLPPRPGGVIALLERAGPVDVVLLAHTGLDRFPTFADLARAVPLRRPVRIEARRIDARTIPAHPEAQIEWLDALWTDLDDIVAADLDHR